MVYNFLQLCTSKWWQMQCNFQFLNTLKFIVALYRRLRIKSEELKLFAVIQSGDMYRDIPETPLLYVRAVRALSAIFLAVRSLSVRGVGSWKMTSWLLCVILLMRMSSRSRRVHRHCCLAARGPTNWTIVNRSMKMLLSWLVTELLYLPNRRILLEYGTLR